MKSTLYLICKFFLACVVYSQCALFPQSALAQQDYPNRAIRVILAYAPGASSDIVARIYGQKIVEKWGHQIIYDFKPGGNTIIASEALVRAAPDGYTFLLILNTHAINPLLTKLPYDTLKDFLPVASLGIGEYMLAINAEVPANNLKEFIAYAKSKPNALNYSTSGAGGLGHLSAELFNLQTGIKTTHVPFKGGAPSVVALISGEVQFSFIHPTNVQSHIKSGKLKGIAISGKNRFHGLPDVATFAELGMPNFESTNWFGLLAPAGTPKSIVNKWSTEIARLQTLPDVKEKLNAQGIEPWTGDSDQFSAHIKSDMDKFSKVVKAANIKLVY